MAAPTWPTSPAGMAAPTWPTSPAGHPDGVQGLGGETEVAVAYFASTAAS